MSFRPLLVAGALVCLLAAPAPHAQPAPPADAFEATVPVDDESEASRAKGLRAALIVVLKRVVGRADVATSAVLGRASTLVQYSSFLRDEAGATQLRAVFDSRAVQAALKSQGLPVFGVDAGTVESWSVDVAGVRSASDYARVMRHFVGIAGVQRVDVESLGDANLRLRMVVEGGSERAAELALAGGLLREDAGGGYVLAR